MSNSMIFGGHFENMQTRSLRRHFSACQHWLSDSAYQITPNEGVNHFLHKMPVLVNFSDFFPDCFISIIANRCSYLETGSSVHVQSVKSGSEQLYSPNTNCMWTIRGPIGSRIQILVRPNMTQCQNNCLQLGMCYDQMFQTKFQSVQL